MRDYERLVLERLWHELQGDIDLNAALGYQVDPDLPAPEVFERPGWKVRWLPAGLDRWKVTRFESAVGAGAVAGYDPMSIPDHHIDEYEPLARAWMETWRDPGVKHFYGLGLNVEDREWLVFRLGSKPGET